MVNLIHIGDYKTGTSWLQNHVFLQHPELLYVDWPSSHPDIARLLYELVGARDLDFDTDSMRDRLFEKLSGLDKSGKKMVVSRESLSGDFISAENVSRTASRLHQVFGPTKILVVIREPFSMLASIYSEYVKIGGTLSLRNFIRDPLVAGHLLERLKYYKQLQAYVDEFGRDNVMIKLFDEFRGDEKKFLQDILTFIGCENTEFYPQSSQIANPALTRPGAFVLRFLNRFIRTHINPGSSLLPLDKLVSMVLSANTKQSLLASASVQLPWIDVPENSRHCLLYAINMAMSLRFSRWCSSIRIGAKISIPDDIRLHFGDTFKASNRELIERFELDLEKYDWSL